jgi:hypothetical protein
MVTGPRWALTPRQTGRLAVGRKLTSTSTDSFIFNCVFVPCNIADLLLTKPQYCAMFNYRNNQLKG